MPTQDDGRPSFISADGDLFVKDSGPQTLHAWEPFGDCVEVNFDLQNSDIDEEHPEWRMKWVFGVAMLRTVGHVLAKVDAPASPNNKRIIDHRWKTWKANREENWIFWQFIENERNNILKTYSFGVEIDESGLWHSDLGEDGVQLIREATYWWRKQLEEIEDAIRLE